MDKRILFTVASVFAAVITLAARESISASDLRITYVGRTLRSSDGTVSFDWSGVYTRISFTGGSLSLDASDSRKDRFNVWIDREPSANPDRIIIIDRDTTIVLFQQKERKPKAHSIVLQKRTEGNEGCVTFRAFHAEGAFLQAPVLKDRVIEFIGDSYTCGYGSENSVKSDPYRPEDENPAKTYADILGRFFGADVLHLSHSGQGICRNYNDAGKGYHMPHRYHQVFDSKKEPLWDFAALTPSLTVIYLGTNDFSTGRQPSFPQFQAAYLKLLKDIKAAYGESHPVLCVSPPGNRELYDYVRRVVEGCMLKNVYYAGLPQSTLNGDSDRGAHSHPSYSGHLKKAYCLVAPIATIMDWTIESKPLE